MINCSYNPNTYIFYIRANFIAVFWVCNFVSGSPLSVKPKRMVKTKDWRSRRKRWGYTYISWYCCVPETKNRKGPSCFLLVKPAKKRNRKRKRYIYFQAPSHNEGGWMDWQICYLNLKFFHMYVNEPTTEWASVCQTGRLIFMFTDKSTLSMLIASLSLSLADGKTHSWELILLLPGKTNSI